MVGGKDVVVRGDTEGCCWLTQEFFEKSLLLPESKRSRCVSNVEILKDK
jgi:hypothetical protein